MISVTTANPNSSASGVGFGASATSSPSGAALDGGEFLLELQAALALPGGSQEDPLADDKAAASVPPEPDQAALAELQNLPTAAALQTPPPAIFTAPVATAQTLTVSVSASAAATPTLTPMTVSTVPAGSDVAVTDALPAGSSAAVEAAPAPAAAAQPLQASEPAEPPSAARSPALQALAATPAPAAAAFAAAPAVPASAAAAPAALASAAAAPTVVNPSPLAPAAAAAAVAPQLRQLASSSSSSALPVEPADVVATPSGAFERSATAPTSLGELSPAQVVLAKTGEFKAELAQADAPQANPATASVQGLAGQALPDGQAADAAPLAATPALAQPSTSLAANQPLMEPAYRSPVEPQHMRLDTGPVQVQVLKLVQQGGGQIVMQLTPPDQGTYRLDLRLDAQGQAHLVVEGASDSVRTRLEQGEGGLRDQLAQLGLNLQLDYRQPGSAFAAADSSESSEASTTEADGPATAASPGASRSRGNAERGLVHLYA